MCLLRVIFKVTAPTIVEYYIKTILQWIGCTAEEYRESIHDNSIDSFSDIIMFTEKYISNLSTDFSGRTQAIGKIHFGMRRKKRTKALLHWVKDFIIVSQEILPSLRRTKSCLSNSWTPLCTGQISERS